VAGLGPCLHPSAAVGDRGVPAGADVDHPPLRLDLDDREEPPVQERVVLVDGEIGLAPDGQLLAVLDAPPLPAELDRNRRRHRQQSPLSSLWSLMDAPYRHPTVRQDSTGALAEPSGFTVRTSTHCSGSCGATGIAVELRP